MRHKDRVHPGLHPAIVEEDLWERVQARLQQGTARPRGQRGRLADQGGGKTMLGRASLDGARHATEAHASRTDSSSGSPALLTGKLRDEAGDRLTPTHTTRRGTQHRYYVSSRLLSSGGSDPTGWRLPARALEEVVARLVAEHIKGAAQRHLLVATPEATTAGAVAAAATALAAEVSGPKQNKLRRLIVSGELRTGGLSLVLCPATLAATLGVPADELHPALPSIDAPLRLRRRKVETKLVAGQTTPAPDPTLTRMLARAHGWVAELRRGKPLTDMARRDGCSESYLRTRAQLAFLSPRIQAAILEGTQPAELSLERLARTGIPLDWSEQEKRFGFMS